MKMPKRASDLYKVSAVALALVASNVVMAQPPQADESELIAKVQADGTLFGFAQACRLSKEELTGLFDLKLTTTRDFVQSKVPHYTSEQFKADFRSGIESAQEFVGLADPGSDAYDRNCRDIHQKVTSLLQER